MSPLAPGAPPVAFPPRRGFTLVQAGTNLVAYNADGAGSTLTIPSGISLTTQRTPRFARFKKYAILVNSVSRPICIDDSGVVRPLVPQAPVQALTLAGASGGALTGSYLARQTFVTLDVNGNLVSESDFSPLMASPVTIASQYLKVNGINISPDNTVTLARIYRTTTNGSVYFKWIDIQANNQTTFQDDLSDASLSVVAAPILGSVPNLSLCTEWQARLWGVDRFDADTLRYTEAGTMHAWSPFNAIPIGHVGSDENGIMALVPRRNALGVGRRNQFVQVTGTTRQNFTQTVIREECGVESQESVVVYKDTAYFLWRDGVYKWDYQGITCVSDGKVRTWFTTDTYFNRSMYYRAQAVLDPVGMKYRLLLCSTGSVYLDRWVEYDLNTGAWYGPHKTSVFTPSCLFQIYGSDGKPYHMMGSLEGYVSYDQDAKNDWGLAGIAASALTRQYYGNDPSATKYFDNLYVLNQAQPSTSGLITITMGGDIPSGTFTIGKTVDRTRVGRLGVGRFASLQFDHTTINEDLVLYGFEFPYNVVGQR